MNHPPHEFSYIQKRNIELVRNAVSKRGAFRMWWKPKYQRFAKALDRGTKNFIGKCRMPDNIPTDRPQEPKGWCIQRYVWAQK